MVRSSRWPADTVGPAHQCLVVGGEALTPTDLGRLLKTDNSSLHMSRSEGALVLDFGRVVSGKIEADLADASGTPIAFSTSESLEFLSIGSDTQAYGNGDVLYRPGGGRETWHAFVRRTFRYLLVTLTESGWVEFDRVGLYYTAPPRSSIDVQGLVPIRRRSGSPGPRSSSRASSTSRRR
jgi:hypothetical protein